MLHLAAGRFKIKAFMDKLSDRVKLIRLLRLAYSGELAAAHAYRGHASSVRRPDERAQIINIEKEEWRHRYYVGLMLAQLGSGPSRWREVKYWLIGHTVGLGCRVCGWFTAMYGAGKLENKNVMEYLHAARYASRCGHYEFVEGLLEMAGTEWEHEHYFREKVIGHRWSRFIKVWPALPSKDIFQIELQNLSADHQN